MKNRILFIHPPLISQSRVEIGLKYPPMGIVFLAAIVRQNGYSVKIIDANVERSSFKEIEEVLQDYRPSVVGISFTSLLSESAHLTARLIKEFNKDIIIMAGGYHPTVMPLEIINDTNFDFVCSGEGEVTFIEWLKKLESGEKDFNKVKGLVFKQGGQIVITPPRELIPELDILPMPAYDLLQINRYSSLASTRKPYVTYIRSRGCPFYCIFCGVQKMFTRRYRCQSPEKTISEIDILVNDFKIREINFKDSDFLINRDNVKKLCELLIAKNYDLIWTCNARVDMVNDEILSLMKKSGCRLISFGVESGNQEVLDKLKKGITAQQTKEAVKLVRKHKIICAFDMILGGIGETRESFEQTLRFLRDLSPDYVAFSYLTAFPGSELYDEAVKNNWFIDGKNDNYDYEELRLNATNLPNGELSKLYKKAFGSFYFRPGYILHRLRCLTVADFKNNLKGFWRIMKGFLVK